MKNLVIPPESEFPFRSEVFAESFKAYLEMRARAKKPATLFACKLLFKRFKEFREDEVIEALEKSIVNNWTDVYPKKKDRYGFI